MRTLRIAAGCRRIAIIAALIISLPVLFGLWSLVALGHPPPRYVYVFLIVGLGAYIAVTSLEWIIAAFMGEDDPPSAGQPATALPAPASPIAAVSSAAPSSADTPSSDPVPASPSPESTPPSPTPEDRSAEG